MNRVVKTIPISSGRGPRQVRYTVRLEGDECAFGTFECWHEQQLLMRTIVDTPEVLFCGPSRPHRVTIFYGGTNWIAEAEATVTEEAASATTSAPSGTREPQQGD